MDFFLCVEMSSQDIVSHKEWSKLEQRLKGGKEKDNFPYLNASRKPRNVGLVGPRLTNVGLVGLLAVIK